MHEKVGLGTGSPSGSHSEVKGVKTAGCNEGQN